MRAPVYVLMGVLGGMGMAGVFNHGGELTIRETPMRLSFPALASASSPASAPVLDSKTEDPKPWTGEDLLEMAQVYDQQADELQSEAVKLEQRAINLAQKPYMDPKGFSRTGFMHIAASRWKAAKELRELAAMHRSEGQRLLALEKEKKDNPNEG
jgi:hypothetical protein